MRRALWALPLLLFCAPDARAQDALDNGIAGDLQLDLVLTGLNGVTGADFLPDGRMLMTEQNSGNVLLYDFNTPPQVIGTININASGSERGLLNVVVDPMFASSRRLYFYYSTGNTQSVGWVTLNANDTLDSADPTEIITGLAANRNHDGGGLAFGPDGFVYVAVGDTGCNCGCQPGTNTDNYFPTCLNKLHGKILRVDRDGNIPATNPLVGVTDVAGCNTADSCGAADDEPTGSVAPRTEIYNWGFRNPWRIAFHPAGPLWIGDVGEVSFEEITISTGPAQHHGWPFREGNAGQADTVCNQSTPTSGTCVDPVFALDHDESPGAGRGSITGGAFATHCSWPMAWRNRYFFGDYVKSRVWTLIPNATGDAVMGNRDVIIRNAGGPVHFVEGPDGAIYYININRGTMLAIRPANPVPCDTDAGVIDMGEPDLGPEDTGVEPDAGPVDTGLAPDAGPADTGVVDTGPPAPDMGVVVDAGASTDSGSTDATPGEDGTDACSCSSHSEGFNGLGLAGLMLGLWFFRRRKSA